MAGGPLGVRFTASKLGRQKDFAKPRCKPAAVRQYVGQRTGTLFVPCTNGSNLAGRPGADGRDAFRHRHFWHGSIFGEQTAAGAGYSHGPWRAAQRSVARSIGTLVPIACFRLGLGLTPWDSHKPRVGSYRVSGNSP